MKEVHPFLQYSYHYSTQTFNVIISVTSLFDHIWLFLPYFILDMSLLPLLLQLGLSNPNQIYIESKIF
jgi:hypothetical protein